MNVNRLKGKMAEKDITQASLAALIGISTNSLSRKMLGKREFRLSEVVDICKVLEIEDPKGIFFEESVPNTQH